MSMTAMFPPPRFMAAGVIITDNMKDFPASEIMMKLPGVIARLPRGLIALPWWYEPDLTPHTSSGLMRSLPIGSLHCNFGCAQLE
jgi:hypothetical protein